MNLSATVPKPGLICSNRGIELFVVCLMKQADTMINCNIVHVWIVTHHDVLSLVFFLFSTHGCVNASLVRCTVIIVFVKQS